MKAFVADIYLSFIFRIRITKIYFAYHLNHIEISKRKKDGENKLRMRCGLRLEREREVKIIFKKSLDTAGQQKRRRMESHAAI